MAYFYHPLPKFKGTWAWAGDAEKTSTHNSVGIGKKNDEIIKKIEDEIGGLPATTHIDFYTPEAGKAEITFLKTADNQEIVAKTELSPTIEPKEKWGAFVKRVVQVAKALEGDKGVDLRSVPISLQPWINLQGWKFRQQIATRIREKWIASWRQAPYGEYESLPARCLPLDKGSSIDHWLYEQMNSEKSPGC